MKFFNTQNIPIYATKVLEKRVPKIDGRTDGKIIEEGKCLVDGLYYEYRMSINDSRASVYILYKNDAWYKFPNSMKMSEDYQYKFDHDKLQCLFTKPRKAHQLEK